MKNKGFYYIIGAFLLGFLVFIHSTDIFAIDTCSEGYKINQSQTKEIDCQGICKEVTNNCGSDIFVPTKTAAEWSDFRSNKPGCISLDDCYVCGPPGTPCDDDDNCTIDDQCNAGDVCVGTAVTCAQDDDPCTIHVCSSSSGLCVLEYTYGPCNDNNGCTTGDICDGPICEGTDWPNNSACYRCQSTSSFSHIWVDDDSQCHSSSYPDCQGGRCVCPQNCDSERIECGFYQFCGAGPTYYCGDCASWRDEVCYQNECCEMTCSSWDCGWEYKCGESYYCDEGCW